MKAEIIPKPKMKSLADTKEWKELRKKIVEANKDPKFIGAVKEFIRYHGRNPDSK